uniref:Altered inheritance of mitochondria protein 3 n=1 Tax=Drosophila rhopaloa TaxID=1041015 RepID=A0A6P4EK40_DRORH
MPSLWLFISMVALVSCQDYHYQRPHTPFFAETARPQPQTTRFVVQTLGRTYGLETQRAPAVYEDHQTQIVQVLEQRQVPQYQQQQQYAYQPQQQLHTSIYQNPLLARTNYQAPVPAAPAPPPNYYVPPQQPQQSQLQPQQTQAPNYYPQQQPAAQPPALDGFDYKQTVPGDTREYQRFVTSCPGGGQCQQKELSPGEVDDSHKKVLQTARASTQPRVEGCFKSPVIYVPVGAAVNAQGQLRPKNRRANERQEQVLSRYPYN